MKIDPRTENLRAHLDHALATGEPLHPAVQRVLIGSWEIMRRALAEAPLPQLAVDAPETEYGIWHARTRRPALSAVADGATLERIDAQPARPERPEQAGCDAQQRTDAEVIRELAAAFEASQRARNEPRI